MSRRLVIAGVASAAVLGAVLPSFAQSAPPLPVYVHVSTNDGVGVGTGVGDQPLVGARVSDGEACVGFSYEIPFCAGGPIK